MIYLGFYQEMDSTESDIYRESLRDAVANPGNYSEEAVATYLDSGHPILDIMEMTRDLVGNSFQVPGGSSVATDGEFAWRVDLVHYVRKYRLQLPEEFVAKVNAQAHTVPSLPQEELVRISAEICDALGFRVG